MGVGWAVGGWLSGWGCLGNVCVGKGWLCPLWLEVGAGG